MRRAVDRRYHTVSRSRRLHCLLLRQRLETDARHAPPFGSSLDNGVGFQIVSGVADLAPLPQRST